MPDVRSCFDRGVRRDLLCAYRFLHADPTPSALQVFLPAATPALASAQSAKDVPRGFEDSLPQEQGAEEGVWLLADPKPRCVVVNIGDMCAASYFSPCYRVSPRIDAIRALTGGRYGQTASTEARFIGDWGQ